ncbi:MAG: septal ring lytic transglycosylase RlpA family protein [Chromatiales bacterium]|jgi:rare lipoprotein A|nr:MAG: septal ring lytic transglycosylase RlpA family protein [Chromatiales bacterium]
MNTVAGAWAGLLAATVLLVGCTPAQWPIREEGTPVSRKPAQVRAPKVNKAPAVPAAPTPGAGNPPFYEVFGERYFVLPSSEGYREQGVASWYGKPFHGRRTSSGEVFDMYKLTAAHKTLPLPSLVRVTSLDSGRSIVVTVNDRGPFVKDRIIDLSFGAAKELDILEAGTGRVQVEAVASGSGNGPAGPTLAPIQLLFMQVGAFSDEGNAARLKAQLESDSVNNVAIRYDDRVSPALYRVRIGPISGPAEYDALASRVASLGIANPRLVTESVEPLPAR